MEGKGAQTHVDDPRNADIRIWINLLLAVGILLQATLTALGLRRYKRNWPKMEGK